MVQDLSNAFAEVFVQRALLYLRQRIVLPRLVTRDTDMTPAQRGKTLNFYRSGTYVANDKTITGTYTPQDSSLTKVQLILDQHKEATTIVHEVEQVFANLDLIDTFMPALMDPILIALEDAIAAEYANATTAVGSGAAIASPDLWREAKQKLQEQNSPMSDLMAVISPKSEFDALDDAKFVQADQSGDGGRALREGFIGRKFGFDTFVSNAIVQTGATPTVDHNLFFHKQALAFASRPLASLGAIPGASRVSANDPESGLAVNVLTRWHEEGGMAVTAEMLFGVVTLDGDLLIDAQSQQAA